MSEETCSNRLALRWGSAACDLPEGHDGAHAQHVTGRTWTTEHAAESWVDDEA